MAYSSPSPSTLRHVVMLPFMAKGHAVPMLHLTRLLLHRGLASAVTVLATPREASFIRAAVAGIPAGAAVLELPFPSSSSAGPQSMEDRPSAASDSDFLDLISATATLRPAVADALARRLEPPPDLLVRDGFLPWAKDAADALGVPRLVSLGMGAFSVYVSRAVMVRKPHARVSLPWEPFDDPEPAGRHWGFFSHCGWNSVTESISMGVPILAFPLAAEQKMNAKFVVDVLGAGLRVWPSNRGDGSGGGSEGAAGDIGALARELVLGEAGKHAAARAAELADSARTAMDAGGSSFENLELMVRAVTSGTGTTRVEASSE